MESGIPGESSVKYITCTKNSQITFGSLPIFLKHISRFIVHNRLFRDISLLCQFLMHWVFMHIALKGCRPLHTNELVQFWIGFGLVLIGGSGLNSLGLLARHWIIQQVIDRNAIENL